MPPDPNNKTPETNPQEAPPRKSLSWATILAWIALAFLLAALVAYRLVTPFFHRPS